jgi:hypothetical protein
MKEIRNAYRDRDRRLKIDRDGLGALHTNGGIILKRILRNN